MKQTNTYQHIYINSTIYLLNAKSLYGVKVCIRVQLNCGSKKNKMEKTMKNTAVRQNRTSTNEKSERASERASER